MPDEDHPRRPDSERRLRQAARLARILRVLGMIHGRARYGPREIAAELEVSERTVFRDLNVLELAGVPWSLRQGASALLGPTGLPLPGLEPFR